MKHVPSGEAVHVEAQLFTPGGVAHLVSETVLKLRLEFFGGELIIRPQAKEGSVSLNFPDPTVPTSIDQLAAAASIYGLLHRAQAEGSRLDLFLDGDRLGELGVSGLAMPEIVLGWCSLVELLRDVLHEIGAPPATKVRVASAYEAVEKVAVVRTVLRGDFDVLTATLQTDLDLEELPTNQIVVPMVVGIPLGEVRVQVVLVAEGVLERSGPQGQFSMAFQGGTITRKELLHEGDPPPISERTLLKQALAQVDVSDRLILDLSAVLGTDPPGSIETSQS